MVTSFTDDIKTGSLHVSLVPLKPIGTGPSVTIISSLVTKTTVITLIETEEYKLMFRNKPIMTTVTNTKEVSSVLTSYVTQTITIQPNNLLPLLT